MDRTLAAIACLVVLFQGEGAAAATCAAAYTHWGFGGRSFKSSAAELCARGNPVEEDGFTYWLGSYPCEIESKERAVRSGERLPYGVSTTDSPAQAHARIAAAGVEPSYMVSGPDPTPVSVRPVCANKVGEYDFEFVYDHDGHMTKVRESLLMPYRE